MNLWTLSFKYLMRRWGSAALTILVGALGLALLSTVMTMADDIPAAVKKSLGGADMVVGPKGSELDLVMCCALHITAARGLVPYHRVAEAVKNPFIKVSVPVALGDSYNGTRILWTRPEILEIYGAQLDQGRMWSGAMEAVVGSEAAREQGLKLGSVLISTHGLDLGGDLHQTTTYRVVGLLKPTGSVIDRLILSDLKSIQVVHAGLDPDEKGPDQIAGKGYDKSGNPLAVSAFLARFSSPIAAAIVPRQISQDAELTAANPLLEMARLSALVRPIFNMVMVFGVVFGIVAGLMAAIGLMSAMNNRVKDLALLRILGASRSLVARVAVQEAVILVHLAFLLSLVLAIALATLIGSRLATYGLLITPFASFQTLAILYSGALLAGLIASVAPVVRAIAADGEGVLKA